MNDANPFRAPEAQLGGGATTPNGTPGQIDVGAALSEGWQYTKDNLGLLIGAMFVFFLLVFVSAITVIGYIFLVPTFAWGYYRLLLNVPGGQAQIKDMFSGFENYAARTFPLLGMVILSMLPGLGLGMISGFIGATISQTVGGIFQLVTTIGAMYISFRWMFSYFYMIDQGTGAVESLKTSWHATDGQVVHLLLFALAAVGINLAGALALGLGLFVTVPMTTMAMVVAYRQLSGR